MIGLKRGTVQLVPHNKRWTVLFEQEKRLLQSCLGGTALSIQHVGSTAIPGIKAKPILDIDVGVASVQQARTRLTKLRRLGYTFRPASTTRADRWKLTYVKGQEARRTVHLHILRYQGMLWQKNLFFRDALRHNMPLARAYEKLKLDLAKKYPQDRKSYTAAKAHFISQVLSQRVPKP